MFSIHKPGQGYWTRLMSFIAGCALAAAGAMWAWAQLGAIEVPTKAWSFSTSDVSGQVGMGERVAILGRSGVEVGSGLALRPHESGILELSGVSYQGNKNDISGLSTASGFSASAVPPIEIPLFQLEFLQGGVGIVILALGGALSYYLCYAARGASDFLIATEGEMKKVNWSTRREVFGSTWVVIVISLIIASVLLFADFLFSQFFTLIRVIEMT